MRFAIPLSFLAACGGDPAGDGGPYFETSMFFNRDVGDADISPNSAQWISSLRANGGFGYGDRLLIDFNISVLAADAAPTMREFTPMPEYFYDPDCDRAPVPVPAIGSIEGETGYACENGGDCHLIIHDAPAGKLYEMYKADIADTFRGGCLAVWDTTASYGDTLRGDECSSADGAGLPIAPLLFTADEVAAGEIAHAIRFVLPNDRLAKGFVRPATHGTDTDGPTGAPPYGIHMRLDPNYPVEQLPTPGAQVVARALQRYGMIHADGGEIALTAASDRYTTAKWAGLLAREDLEELRLEDFDVVDHGDVITYPYTCNR